MSFASGSICWVREGNKVLWPVAVFSSWAEAAKHPAVDPSSEVECAEDEACVFYFANASRVLRAAPWDSLLEWRSFDPIDASDAKSPKSSRRGWDWKELNYAVEFARICVDKFALALPCSASVDSTHEERVSSFMLYVRDSVSEPRAHEPAVAGTPDSADASGRIRRKATTKPSPADDAGAKSKPSDEVEVESIVAHDGSVADLSILEFRVRWKGCGEAEDEWHYYKDLRNLRALDEYVERTPELSALCERVKCPACLHAFKKSSLRKHSRICKALKAQSADTPSQSSDQRAHEQEAIVETATDHPLAALDEDSPAAALLSPCPPSPSAAAACLPRSPDQQTDALVDESPLPMEQPVEADVSKPKRARKPRAEAIVRPKRTPVKKEEEVVEVVKRKRKESPVVKNAVAVSCEESSADVAEKSLALLSANAPLADGQSLVIKRKRGRPKSIAKAASMPGNGAVEKPSASPEPKVPEESTAISKKKRARKVVAEDSVASEVVAEHPTESRSAPSVDAPETSEMSNGAVVEKPLAPKVKRGRVSKSLPDAVPVSEQGTEQAPEPASSDAAMESPVPELAPKPVGSGGEGIVEGHTEAPSLTSEAAHADLIASLESEVQEEPFVIPKRKRGGQRKVVASEVVTPEVVEYPMDSEAVVTSIQVIASPFVEEVVETREDFSSATVEEELVASTPVIDDQSRIDSKKRGREMDSLLEAVSVSDQGTEQAPEPASSDAAMESPVPESLPEPVGSGGEGIVEGHTEAPSLTSEAAHADLSAPLESEVQEEPFVIPKRKRGGQRKAVAKVSVVSEVVADYPIEAGTASSVEVDAALVGESTLHQKKRKKSTSKDAIVSPSTEDVSTEDVKAEEIVEQIYEEQAHIQSLDSGRKLGSTRIKKPVTIYDDSLFVKKKRQSKVQALPSVLPEVLVPNKKIKKAKKGLEIAETLGEATEVESEPAECLLEDFYVKKRKSGRELRISLNLKLWREEVLKLKFKKSLDDKIAAKRKAAKKAAAENAQKQKEAAAAAAAAAASKSKRGKNLDIIFKGEVVRRKAENPFGQDSQFLIENCTCKIFQRLYASTSLLLGEPFDNMSAIGAPVWSDDWFQDVTPALEDACLSAEGKTAETVAVDEGANTIQAIDEKASAIQAIDEGTNAAQVVETLVEEQGDEGECAAVACSHGGKEDADENQAAEEVFAEECGTGARSKRKGPSIGKPQTIGGLYQDLTRTKLDQHTLITPLAYGVPISDDGEIWQQPFEVVAHPQVGFICDVHSHLCECEVIGLLAGKWDGENGRLYIQVPFPCSAIDRHDDGSTDVELDPIAELEVREVIASLGLVVVGWYHSHPKFKPNPSITDVFNQSQYQSLMRDSSTGMDPFVGLICSTYDPASLSVTSWHKWFHCRPYDDSGRLPSSAQIPFEVNVKLRSAIEITSRKLNSSELSSEFSSLLISKAYVSIEDAVAGKVQGNEVSSQQSNISSTAEIVNSTVEIPNSERGGRRKRQPSISEAVGDAAEKAEVPSLLGFLAGESESEVLARDLVASASPVLRGVTLAIVNAGFYYSQNSRRVALLNKWKGFGSRLDKIKGSSVSFLQGLGLSETDQYAFVEEISNFLSACWIQFGSKKSKQKTPRVTV